MTKAKKKKKPRTKPQEANRQFYQYYNGEKLVLADPIKLYRKLLSYPDLNLDHDIKLISAAGDNPQGIEALERLLKATRDIFQVKEYEEKGLLDSEVMDLLVDFSNYMLSVKKNTNSTQTWQKPTEQVFSEGSAKNVTSVSSSIDSGQWREEQQVPLSESVPV